MKSIQSISSRLILTVLLSAVFLLPGCAGSYARQAFDKVTGKETVYIFGSADQFRMDIVQARRVCSGKSAAFVPPPAPPQQEVTVPGDAIANLAEQLSYASQVRAARDEIAFACMAEHGWNFLGAIEFRDVNAVAPGNPYGATPLHIAAQHDNYDVVNFLISKGADVNLKNNQGLTSLHLAAESNAVKSAQALVYGGADIEAKDKSHATPLHAATFSDNIEVADLLIKSGADVNATTDGGGTPLHVAAASNARKTAGLLAAEGADIEAQGGDEGLTPLHIAALSGSVEVADLLVARGANLKATSYGNETPLDVARREKKRDVVALLERAERVAAEKTQTAAGDESITTMAANKAEIVFENAWRSIVVVVAGNSQGGGVVINEPNTVATNCHVIDQSPRDIRVYKGENRRAVRDEPYLATIAAGDRNRDICILSIPGLWAIPAKIRLAADLSIGEQVFAVGAPQGLDFSISGGVISQLRSENGGDAPLIQTDAAISPGSSGGGLFDAQGNLVGITTSKIREGENLNFAHPIEWALEL